MNADTTGELHSQLMRLKSQLDGAGESRRVLIDRGVTPVVVEDALRRYAAGEYGFCSSCHLAIPRGELLMYPYAKTCKKCRPKPAA